MWITSGGSLKVIGADGALIERRRQSGGRFWAEPASRSARIIFEGHSDCGMRI
jgi:hypothetical protein